MSRKNASPARTTKRITAISLFSGCGGSDLALVESGVEVVWANDLWEPACLTYKDNIPGAKIVQGDISKFETFPAADLLVGCYPCQGYSQGGRRASDAPVNFLYQQFDRVLRIVKPKAFIVENVNGMAYGDNAKLLANQLCRYRFAGYSVNWRVLDAKDYGLAQTRRRIFIVGVRSDVAFEYAFPEPQFGPGRSHPYRTQRDVIGGLPPWPGYMYCREPLHWYYLSRNRRADWDDQSPCIVGHWRHVPLHPLSPTLRNVGPDKWQFAEKRAARRLTYRECALLQGFPASWKFTHGRLKHRFKMIGNAVPPPLFKAVLTPLLPALREGSLPSRRTA